MACVKHEMVQENGPHWLPIAPADETVSSIAVVQPARMAWPKHEMVQENGPHWLPIEPAKEIEAAIFVDCLRKAHHGTHVNNCVTSFRGQPEIWPFLSV
jgi:hypothetical protein